MHHFSTSAMPYRVIVIACVWAASAIIFPPSPPKTCLVYSKFLLLDKAIPPAISPARSGVCQDRLLFPCHPPALESATTDSFSPVSLPPARRDPPSSHGIHPAIP